MDISDSRILALTGYSLVLGALLGVCWGLLSFVRILLTPIEARSIKGRAVQDIVTFFCDISFALFAAICTVFLFFGANGGRIRLLGLVGCAVGFCAFHYTVGLRLIRFFSRFVGGIRRGIRWVWRHTFGAVWDLSKRLCRRPVNALRRKREQRVRRKAERARQRRGGQYRV